MNGKRREWTAFVAALGLAIAAAAHASDAKPAAQKTKPAEAGTAMPEPRTLEGYVEQEKAFYETVKKKHPLFKYEKEGRLVGKYTLSDREEEFVEFGGGKQYAAKAGQPTAITYRLPAESILDLPNKYVGAKKCGECHPAQYERWLRSRHNLTVRFPGEVTEADLKKPPYATSPATPLPEGITPDVVYAVIGTPRTKYGFLDGWLVRGTYHVEGGLLRDGTGTLVAGGNQFSATWARDLTPAVARKIATWVPGFPTTLEAMGGNGSNVWGVTSYGAVNRKSMLFQPASSYCEVCHSFKFDFKSDAELLSALGNPAELQKHTINLGITCEECHGAGAHLVGGHAKTPSNCERCHQRFAWNEDDAKANPKQAFNAYFKSRCPSCGTEGSQAFYTKHTAAGMSCATCHDPHEVTANDWRDHYTVPGIKKTCESCHETQAAFAKKSDMHGGNACASCHMPAMMSCENFTAIQFPDYGGFDAQRTSHIWRIKVDPEAKTLNPPPGKPRDTKEGPWRLAKENGRPFVDLMWSCGRTSWSDPNLAKAGGCHSPVQSELPTELHFTNQRQIYDRVMAWEKPVKDGIAEVQATLAKVRPALAAAKPSARAGQAQAMVNQAQLILDAIEKDGSNGVHAPKYTLARVNEARLLSRSALGMVQPKLTQR